MAQFADPLATPIFNQAKKNNHYAQQTSSLPANQTGILNEKTRHAFAHAAPFIVRFQQPIRFG